MAQEDLLFFKKVKWIECPSSDRMIFVSDLNYETYDAEQQGVKLAFFSISKHFEVELMDTLFIGAKREYHEIECIIFRGQTLVVGVEEDDNSYGPRDNNQKKIDTV